MSSYPRNVLRLVMQVKDTPDNRLVVKTVFDQMLRTKLQDTQTAVLKYERVEISDAAFPMPNTVIYDNPAKQ